MLEASHEKLPLEKKPKTPACSANKFWFNIGDFFSRNGGSEEIKGEKTWWPITALQIFKRKMNADNLLK